MAVTIREFTETDSEQLIGLVRELQLHEAQFFDRMRPPDEIGVSYIRQLQEACEAYRGAIFVAELEGAVVGYSVVITAVTSEEMPDEIPYVYANIVDLAVTRAARRQGIGTKLLEACEHHARNAGVHWLRLSVLTGNSDAIAAYENFGFHHHLLTMEKPL